MRPVLIPWPSAWVARAASASGVATRWMPTPLGPVHVYDAPGAGSVPTTVLLHGITRARRLRSRARAPAARTSPRRRTRFPGHGFSPAPSANADAGGASRRDDARARRLLDEPAIVVGNSLGGALRLCTTPLRARSGWGAGPRVARRGAVDRRRVARAEGRVRLRLTGGRPRSSPACTTGPRSSRASWHTSSRLRWGAEWSRIARGGEQRASRRPRRSSRRCRCRCSSCGGGRSGCCPIRISSTS